MIVQTYRCNSCGVIRKREDLEELTEELHICHYCRKVHLTLEVFCK